MAPPRRLRLHTAAAVTACDGTVARAPRKGRTATLEAAAEAAMAMTPAAMAVCARGGRADDDAGRAEPLRR